MCQHKNPGKCIFFPGELVWHDPSLRLSTGFETEAYTNSKCIEAENSPLCHHRMSAQQGKILVCAILHPAFFHENERGRAGVQVLRHVGRIR